MSGALGLKNTLFERVIAPLMAYRGGDHTAGKEISFEKFLGSRAVNTNGEPRGIKTANGEPATWEHVYAEFGLNPNSLSVSHLLSLSGDVKYLAPELIREHIVKGKDLEVSHLDLCASEEGISSQAVVTPWIQFKNEAPVTTGEAETIAMAGITWGHKTIEAKKSAIAIEWTDELVLNTPIPILSPFLQKVGIQLGAKLYNDAILTLINGDQADTSDACAVIGVAAPTTRAFKDFLAAWTRGRGLAMRWDSLAENEAEANITLEISQFSTPAAGNVQVELKSRNRIIPAALEHHVSSKVPNNLSVLFDRRFALQSLVFRPLLVESERIIMRQIQGTAVSIIQGYSTIDRTARVIIDKAKNISSYTFPDWMAPIV